MVPGLVDDLEVRMTVLVDHEENCHGQRIDNPVPSPSWQNSTYGRTESSCRNYRGGSKLRAPHGDKDELECDLDKALKANDQPAVAAALEVADEGCPLKIVIGIMRERMSAVVAQKKVAHQDQEGVGAPSSYVN